MSSTPEDAARIAGLLRAMKETLEAERDALIKNDPVAIEQCAGNKLQHLRRLSDVPPDRHDVFAGFTPDIRALAELNLANGALIARRRQETHWTLRQLGLYERDSAYDATGGFGGAVKHRHRTMA